MHELLIEVVLVRFPVLLPVLCRRVRVGLTGLAHFLALPNMTFNFFFSENKEISWIFGYEILDLKKSFFFKIDFVWFW